MIIIINTWGDAKKDIDFNKTKYFDLSVQMTALQQE